VFTKLLVANRGEIAVRVLRAAHELDIPTAAVYSYEDRASLHRLKADEAHPLTGTAGHPVRAYLDVDEIVAVARRIGADALHPGYGFLSENDELALACRQAGVRFVGPEPEVLRLTGNKARVRGLAQRIGVPVLRASEPLQASSDARAVARELGYPVFVKAASGGGGRGLRRVDHEEELDDAVVTAQREAEAAFGDGTVFLEEAVIRPRHIEVQVLGDHTGEVVHLFERDCSVQRRHQKVVEIAPAPALDPGLRERLLDDAVRLAAAADYTNAGTVEFLVGQDGSHAFIEMNPRIQVEHTVTEEITDIDLVHAQLRLAAGQRLADLGLCQDRITTRGVAIQCRVTTEDPANAFRPDLGRLSAVRDVGGAGIRIDSASVEVGMEIMSYFDPLLAKITARGADLDTAARRARRAVLEFRVRGVRTNTAFLAAVLSEPDFLASRVTTSFIDDHPELARATGGADRTSRLLDYIADVTVNRPYGEPPPRPEPRTKLPPTRPAPPPAGSRQLLERLGPQAFAQHLRSQEPLGVTDTTFRDAHQSLLATRVRSYDLVHAAAVQAHRLPGLFSAEVWGGATYDTAIRFLREDPWERLEQLREAMPNVCLQMLLRGQNAVAYGAFPTAVVEAFVREASAAGIDVFRVFDALNDVERMAPAIAVVVDAGRVAEGTVCYTSDLHDPGERIYTLDYYLGVAEKVIAAGAHVLCIKDMAGLLRAPAAETLVSALRERFDAPVHLHTHDTAGGQLATYLAAAQAGVDAVDGAAAPLAGGSSQPSLSSIVAATDHTHRATGLDLGELAALEPYWAAVRRLYAPFEIGLAAPTGRVHQHEIPGGQLSNLRQQAADLGLDDDFERIEHLYAACDRLLGRPIKVTPTSKVVGDLALHLLSTGVTPAELEEDPGRIDLPPSVVDFLTGDLGEPPGGWPEPFRSRALARHDGQRRERHPGPAIGGATVAERRTALDDALFPGPARELASSRERYGDLSILPTSVFLYGLGNEEVTIDLEPGVRLYVELEAISEPDDGGHRTVLLRVNGQTRMVDTVDRSIGVVPAEAERADRDEPGHVASPVTGVVTITTEVGEHVTQGQRVAVIEAMKLESPVGAGVAGRVVRVVAPTGSNVEPGDLLLTIDPDEE
jgi:pyruvate carboxylase